MRVATQHPINEHFRVRAFRSLLAARPTTSEALHTLGELMYQAHVSYRWIVEFQLPFKQLPSTNMAHSCTTSSCLISVGSDAAAGCDLLFFGRADLGQLHVVAVNAGWGQKGRIGSWRLSGRRRSRLSSVERSPPSLAPKSLAAALEVGRLS